MGYVVATLLSAKDHLRKDLALLVHQGQQLGYVFCRFEGVARLHHLQNPSDHLLVQTEADKSVPQLTKSWPLTFFTSLTTNILASIVVLHPCSSHLLKISVKQPE